MRILAIDPGERVGWAAGTVVPTHFDGIDAARPEYALTVERHGISFLKDAAMQVYNAVVVEDRIDVVIYETWILSAKGAKVSVGSDMQSSQFIGMVRLACWLNPRVQLVPQGPGAMRDADKSWRTHPSGAAMKERWDKLPKSHDESHDGSALRHLWTYFFDRYV